MTNEHSLEYMPAPHLKVGADVEVVGDFPNHFGVGIAILNHKRQRGTKGGGYFLEVHRSANGTSCHIWQGIGYKNRKNVTYRQRYLLCWLK